MSRHQRPDFENVGLPSCDVKQGFVSLQPVKPPHIQSTTMTWSTCQRTIVLATAGTAVSHSHMQGGGTLESPGETTLQATAPFYL